jgi:hypothetical protein
MMFCQFLPSWVGCVATFASTIKMEAMCSFETVVDFERITQRYIPEDKTVLS